MLWKICKIKKYPEIITHLKGYVDGQGSKNEGASRNIRGIKFSWQRKSTAYIAKRIARIK